MLGREIATLVDENVEAGFHEVTWKTIALTDISGLGVYSREVDALQYPGWDSNPQDPKAIGF